MYCLASSENYYRTSSKDSLDVYIGATQNVYAVFAEATADYSAYNGDIIIKFVER